jgi:hypothetical protein
MGGRTAPAAASYTAGAPPAHTGAGDPRLLRPRFVRGEHFTIAGPHNRSAVCPPIPCYLTGTCTSGPLETTLGGTGRAADNLLGGLLHGSGDDPLSQVITNLLGRRL